MGQLAQLRYEESAGINLGRLEELIEEYGELAAERHVGRILECIAVRLNKCERAWVSQDCRGLRNSALELASYAAEIGLNKLERVACDVQTAIDSADPAAQGATIARLVRVGEASLLCAWDVDTM